MAASAPGFEKHPNYRIDIEPRPERVQVRAGTALLADSNRAVLVTESRHRPVWYLPLADVDSSYIAATESSTYCPFKGHASYWRVHTPDQQLDDVMWSYREPYAECQSIRDYVAFYTDKVELTVDGRPVGAEGPGWSSE